MATPSSEIAAPPAVQTSLDERLVTLSIEVNGKIKTYQDLYIAASGVKYANPLQNEAEIVIYNLDKATQDYILTETSLYNANFSPKAIILKAGRKSYGTSVIYRGNIVYSSVSQPPDVGVTLKCLTGNFLKAGIIARNQPGLATVEQISRAIAQDTGLRLEFLALDKEVSNYAYAGDALGQVVALAALGQINAFVDDDTLVVKNVNGFRNGPVRQLSAATGMIGIPQFTERGVRVKFFIDNKTVLGGALQVQSDIYPAANGIYVIYQLAFQVTNRQVPFYYIADCARIGTTNGEATNA